jgi:hypothetical protein
MTVGLTLQIWPAHGHYAAPAAGAVLLILLNALRQLRAARNSAVLSRFAWFSPIWFSRATVLVLLLWMLVPISDHILNPYITTNPLLGEHLEIPKEVDCQRLQSQLSRLPGQHLVLVHYHVNDVPSQDWIYNRADIDNSKIVWARDMGQDANQELLRYYPNRQVWYVDRGADSILMPYDNWIALSHPADALLLGAKSPGPVALSVRRVDAN